MTPAAPGLQTASPGLHRFAVLVCAGTFALVFAGGLVTSTDSGLAVPDWPLSFGQVFPEMVGGVAYEHGHRMVAATIGFLVIVLNVWAWMTAAPRGVLSLAAVALATVIVQGLLGGMTVLLKLPPQVSIAHACLAQAFLCMTVALAEISGRGWALAASRREDRAAVPLRYIAVAVTAAVYGQLILGAVVRHTKAGLAIPTFPLANGRLIPPLDSPQVEIQFAHRAWAVVVALLAAWLVARIARAHRDEPAYRRPAVALAVLVPTQIMLGGLTIWTGKAPLPTTMHVLIGAVILGASFLLAMRAWRRAEGAPVTAESRRVPSEAPA